MRSPMALVAILAALTVTACCAQSNARDRGAIGGDCVSDGRSERRVQVMRESGEWAFVHIDMNFTGGTGRFVKVSDIHPCPF